MRSREERGSGIGHIGGVGECLNDYSIFSVLFSTVTKIQYAQGVWVQSIPKRQPNGNSSGSDPSMEDFRKRSGASDSPWRRWRRPSGPTRTLALQHIIGDEFILPAHGAHPGNRFRPLQFQSQEGSPPSIAPPVSCGAAVARVGRLGSGPPAASLRRGLPAACANACQGIPLHGTLSAKSSHRR